VHPLLRLITRWPDKMIRQLRQLANLPTRVAALEQLAADNALRSQMEFILSEVERLTSEQDSSISRIAQLEEQMMAATTRSDKATGLSESSPHRYPNEFPDGNAGEMIMTTTAHTLMEKFKEIPELLRSGASQSETHFNSVALQYGQVVADRDRLLNECDALRLRLQMANRLGGISRKMARRSPPRFPLQLDDEQGVLPINIVDVGAQNLSSEEHAYAPLRNAGATRIIGFEPLKQEAENRRRIEPDVLMLDRFIGHGGHATFRTCVFRPASSLLEPNDEFLRQFHALPEMCSVVRSDEIDTTALDDVQEVSDCDFLKIDVQGGEFAVLTGAARVLQRTVAIHCEVEFAPVYRDQPQFNEIDSLLRSNGFELLDLVNAGYEGYADLERPFAKSRLLWADAIYFKNAEILVGWKDAAKLMRAAYMAHVNYGMYDLAAHYLRHYDKSFGTSWNSVYVQAFRAEAQKTESPAT
jgi:FkbM family methyltransferase